MKPELSKKNEWWIPSQRYYELKHRCLQYDFWKQARNCPGLKAQKYDRLKILSSDIYDPVQEAAESREYWQRKIAEVEYACDMATNDPEEATILLHGVTKGESYEKLEAKLGTLPVSRDGYYEMYRKFFWIMNNLVD